MRGRCFVSVAAVGGRSVDMFLYLGLARNLEMMIVCLERGTLWMTFGVNIDDEIEERLFESIIWAW